MEPKYKKLLWISIGLSLVVLLVVVIFTFNDETIEALKNLQPQYLLFALGLHILALVFWGLRIQVLSRSLGYKVPLFHCVNMAAAGQLLASITPSNIGGEPIRIHELYKAKIPLADSTAIVLVERLLEAFLLVFGVIVGMTMFSLIYNNGEIPQAVITAAWCGTGFFVAILVVLILMMRKPSFIKKVGLKITGLITKKMSEEKQEKVKGDVIKGIDQFYTTFSHFAGKARWGLVVGLILSFAFWACEYSIASVILVGLGYPPNILLSIVFQLIIAVILMIPLTPGSAGIAELCYTAFYSLIMPTSVIGLFVVLLRMILYYSNLLLGFIASFIIVKREAANQEVIHEPD
ncbi:MAG TPA: flippase-like domain-containing protein [Methanocorpusculum sp.]|nr:flippase-like domain-containing protein [Methanocorpusculum sp.]